MFGKREAPPYGDVETLAAPPLPAIETDDPWAPRYARAASNVVMGVGDHLVQALNKGPGATPETLTAASGALAGYAAQHAALDRAREGLGELSAIRTADGESYVLGDGINAFLLPGDPEVPAAWTYIAGGMVRAGYALSELPDAGEIFAHVWRTLGRPEFGQVRAPGGGRIAVSVREAASAWRTARKLLTRPVGSVPETGMPSLYWPAVMGAVCQHTVYMVRDRLPPPHACAIALEAAIAASAIDQRRKAEG